MLDIEAPVNYDNAITSMEWHKHKPYASSTYNNNDEIRIPISQHDLITAPFESTIHISGTLTGTKADGTPATINFTNNAMAFLFENIRLEFNGVEIDRCKNVGITSTIKNILSLQFGEAKGLNHACWLGINAIVNAPRFSYSVPLKMLLGFAEDHKKVVSNVKLELILLRSSSDKNSVISNDLEGAGTWKVDITDIYWNVPHITLSDAMRLKFLNMIQNDRLIHIPFRTWELYEYPNMPQTDKQSWSLKTSTQLEKPRMAIVGLQKDRKNSLTVDASLFDHSDVTNVQLQLNGKYYPYNDIKGDVATFYDMFRNFPKSYYGREPNPMVEFATFKPYTPLYVIDCYYQNDSVLTGPVDVRLEIQASRPFPAGTTCYCLLIHDAHFTYSMLTGAVKKMM